MESRTTPKHVHFAEAWLLSLTIVGVLFVSGCSWSAVGCGAAVVVGALADVGTPGSDSGKNFAMSVCVPDNSASSTTQTAQESTPSDASNEDNLHSRCALACSMGFPKCNNSCAQNTLPGLNPKPCYDSCTDGLNECTSGCVGCLKGCAQGDMDCERQCTHSDPHAWYSYR
jgi:hypothetical protein